MTSLVLRRKGFLFSISLLSCAILSSNNNTNFYEVFRFWSIIIDYIFESFDIETFDSCYQQVKDSVEVIIR